MTDAPTREQVAQAIHDHRPVTGRFANLNPIVGCSCMDRVFVAGKETYKDHITDTVVMPLIRAAQAEALREAADESTEDGGAWDVLALYVNQAGHPYALAGIQRWLRERADRIDPKENE